MQVITAGNYYTYEGPLIFLAGPSLRNISEFTPWRKEALLLFQENNFSGTLAIPEPFCKDYKKQIVWETDFLKMADCILFWIPRSETLPGFTTNIEFGEWMKSGKIVLGFPKEAQHINYIAFRAKEQGIVISHSLEETILSTKEIVFW